MWMTASFHYPLLKKQFMSNSLTKLLSRRGFHLTKWITNHEEVLIKLPKYERSTKVQQYLLGNPTDDRILGIQWKLKEDQLTLNVQIPNKAFPRREVLSTIASLYDLLGFVAPVLLEAQRLLQTLCKQNLGWDEPIRENELGRWKSWLKNLVEFNKIEVFRCLISQQNREE